MDFKGRGLQVLFESWGRQNFSEKRGREFQTVVPETKIYQRSQKRSEELSAVFTCVARVSQYCFCLSPVLDPDASNSSWAEMEPYVIGSYSLKHPLSITMKSRLILQYLGTMGDYQEVGTTGWREGGGREGWNTAILHSVAESQSAFDPYA